MYRQIIDPLGSLPLSALVAAIPLAILLLLLGIFRLKSHWAALAGLAAALVVAVVCYRMPVVPAIAAAGEGLAFGLFPIVWIILNAVWINKLQQESGHFAIVGRAFARISADFRIQAILIAYTFGALIESLSGFGTPVAVTSIMLIALGFTPMKAAVVALFANAAPAAYGSVGNPITALAKVTSLPVHDVGAMVGRQSPWVAFLVPFVLLVMVDGKRGLREVWPAALAAGTGFAVGQFLCSNFFTYALTDLIAAVLSALCVIVVLRLWSPRRPLAIDGASCAEAPLEKDAFPDVLRAFSPYALLTVLFALVELPGPVHRWAKDLGTSFAWPGLHIVDSRGAVVGATRFDFGWMTAPGTMLLLTGLLTMAILRVGPRRAVRCYGRTLVQIRWAAVTISCVLALGYLMNLSGMATTLGYLLAATGAAFALLSAPLGYVGVAVTGSDTGANSLFGALQYAAGVRTGISPMLLAAANSTGGVLGKVIAPQNLAIAATAVGLPGREGDLLRKVALWSLILLALLSLLVVAQSTVLGWMVVGG
ncbi:L-lactate permease [Amycolatopsis sp. NPDC059027]|uniref:L-lactate permease n=1 Tax=unclassified Amycolatopsis TaxID=2618356 RepID=UPI003671A869